MKSFTLGLKPGFQVMLRLFVLCHIRSLINELRTFFLGDNEDVLSFLSCLISCEKTIDTIYESKTVASAMAFKIVTFCQASKLEIWY